jgi:hypothetical protein
VSRFFFHINQDGVDTTLPPTDSQCCISCCFPLHTFEIKFIFRCRTHSLLVTRGIISASGLSSMFLQTLHCHVLRGRLLVVSHCNLKLTDRLTLSLILIETTHEVGTFAQRTARIVSLISYYCSSSLERLSMVNIMLFGGASDNVHRSTLRSSLPHQRARGSVRQDRKSVAQELASRPSVDLLSARSGLAVTMRWGDRV